MREVAVELLKTMRELSQFDEIATTKRERGESLGDATAAFMADARARYHMAVRRLALVLEETRKLHGLAA